MLGGYASAHASSDGGGSVLYLWGVLAIIAVATFLRLPDVKKKYGAERARVLGTAMAVVLSGFVGIATILTIRQA